MTKVINWLKENVGVMLGCVVCAVVVAGVFSMAPAPPGRALTLDQIQIIRNGIDKIHFAGGFAVGPEVVSGMDILNTRVVVSSDATQETREYAEQWKTLLMMAGWRVQPEVVTYGSVLEEELVFQGSEHHPGLQRLAQAAGAANQTARYAAAHDPNTPLVQELRNGISVWIGNR